MAHDSLPAFIDEVWERSIVPTLEDYIRIPNKSPAFDPDWQAHGHMARAVELVASWCRARAIQGLSVAVLQLPDRTPLIFMEVPATDGGARSDSVLLYGHLDKQPEFTGWLEGCGPWEPVRKDDRLYGRGGADDGYSAFAALTAIEALQTESRPHARCVVMIEACEESGSYDLPAYVDHLSERIGDVGLVVCLDSGCGDYDRLWCTTSLRGLVTGNLEVGVLREGVHSGDASGVVPSSFRVARQLISRIEDEKTGAIRLKELQVKIPADRKLQAAATARVLGKRFVAGYPWLDGVKPMQKDPTALLLARTWQPTLSVTGVSGIPQMRDAGNVVRPSTTFKLSLRVPPMCDAARASEQVKRALEREPPYGAHVTFEPEKAGEGWNAPPLVPWLETALRTASRAAFGKDACYMGEGGSIPFMAMLGEKYPRAQFLITGVLGPQSNAHGPNEFLHLPTARRVTECVSHVLVAHATQRPEPRRKPTKAKRKRRAGG
ncbi:MAG TPA: M20 family metallopeptidase [Polyangiales bacterium]|nr:M20 family metallopeptidase [Polyangiales bacterium]